jgi:hypothetical protein
MAAKLADAEDKAESALSMQQSAQTKEDWNLVFDRWKLAIQIAKSIPGKNSQVQQKVAEFQNGLEQATQDAKISLNPSLAPVDPIGSKARGVIGTFGNDEKNDKKPANPTPSAQPQPQQPATSPAASPTADSKASPAPQATPQSKQ